MRPRETPPAHMRLWRMLGLSVMRMEIVSDFGRAKAGETWECLCGSLLGRGIMWPLWRVR